MQLALWGTRSGTTCFRIPSCLTVRVCLEEGRTTLEKRRLLEIVSHSESHFHTSMMTCVAVFPELDEMEYCGEGGSSWLCDFDWKTSKLLLFI